jgi:hypothetical protein
MAAVDRAIAGRDVVACSAPTGTLARLRAPEVSCPGANISDEVARRVDADRVLQAQLDEIVNRGWPAIRLIATPVAALGAGPHTDVFRFFDHGARDALLSIDRADDDARGEIAAALEQGTSREELEALRARAREVDAATAARRATFAQPVFAATDRYAATLAKRGQVAPSWCAQPALLGGCEGAVYDSDPLLSDKKVQKAMAKAATYRADG